MEDEKIVVAVAAVEAALAFSCVDCRIVLLVVVVDSSGDGANEWATTTNNVAAKQKDRLEIIECAAIFGELVVLLILEYECGIHCVFCHTE